MIKLKGESVSYILFGIGNGSTLCRGFDVLIAEFVFSNFEKDIAETIYTKIICLVK